MMNLGIGTTHPVRLDAAIFAHDAELLPIAQAISDAAERERARYRAKEKPIALGLLGIEGYWSDGVPWFEWVSDVQKLDRCAKELQVTLADLADTIAYRIKPANWLMFSWMSEAIRGRADRKAIQRIAERLATKIEADRKQRQEGARVKLANDPKQAEKELVRELWKLWQSEPHRYKGKAAFALDMLEKYGNLKNQEVIARWCRKWEKESGTQPA